MQNCLFSQRFIIFIPCAVRKNQGVKKAAALFKKKKILFCVEEKSLNKYK